MTDEIRATQVIRQNGVNGQKVLTIPKKIKSLKKDDMIEFIEKGDEVKIRKLK